MVTTVGVLTVGEDVCSPGMGTGGNHQHAGITKGEGQQRFFHSGVVS
jgi:hypothetical protein